MAGADTGVIYLDHLASTPLDPAVLAAMLPWFQPDHAGNAQSAHHNPGRQAARAVVQAGRAVAALVEAPADATVTFTPSASEANRLALQGLAPAGAPLLVSAVEHDSVLRQLDGLRTAGHAVTLLPVDGQGVIRLDALEAALSRAGPRPVLSLMAANNEVGSLQPLAAVADLCRRHGALWHCDGVQRVATGPLAVGGKDRPGPDMITLSAHKLYGPQGVGALVARPGLAPATPWSWGTPPTALIMGFAEAARLVLQRRGPDRDHLVALTARLWAGLSAAVPGVTRNGPADGLPGCLNVTLPGVDAADLLLDLPDLALSTGSACRSATGQPSHVLTAMGLDPAAASGSLRFGLGRGTTPVDVDQAVARIAAVLRTR
ncbi:MULTISPECIES: cysteine desulfurase family protein [Nitrospirillum]|uniref:Cysteine desulfurase n=1 Tax=Nitrospirillum amazonense TaxID=28077 RepID=A0A560F078_9PROT|nr:aminotransferase class V-fold PLP-dependent enzyme [Nitrospirillum amazonense]MEC4593910.1 aminotransferase class V-fold PLP-dependent enzyme [Nitrospirillum amazonense]TWB15022.1 cysteine desulfurase [Nitrospirillum amazonense]